MLWALLMTRFKELARIQAAIKHKNELELRWAAEYCQMRPILAEAIALSTRWASTLRPAQVTSSQPLRPPA